MYAALFLVDATASYDYVFAILFFNMPSVSSFTDTVMERTHAYQFCGLTAFGTQKSALLSACGLNLLAEFVRDFPFGCLTYPIHFRLQTCN